MLAISTLWNAFKQPDGAALYDELKDLGFDHIALGRHLTIEQIEQIKQWRFGSIGGQPLIDWKVDDGVNNGHVIAPPTEP